MRIVEIEQMSASASEVAPQTTSQQQQPRPEYPRPQFVRSRWLNLNGLWQFEFDDDDLGLAAKWYLRQEAFSRQILVPFSCEAPRSGIADRSFHPCVWYRRPFRIPADWEGSRILLNFGAVDYRASVWINGSLVGSHEGGHSSFTFEITNEVTKHDCIVVVRAQDPPSDRYIPRGKQYWKEEPASIFYTRTTGIWQTVWIEPVPTSYLENIRITPLIDGSVTFEANIQYPGDAQFVNVSVKRDGRVIAAGMSLADGSRGSVAASVQEPALWSPYSPQLYDATLQLGAPGGILDEVDVYFGFRSITTQDGKIVLNGDPIYLKTVLDQGYWPESNLTPPDDDAIRTDVLLAKQLGFNGVRKHQKVEDPRYLYWADKLGLMVSAEMANAYLFSDESVARLTREWMEVVRRDYNHPSIVMWTPMNESWGIPNVADPRQQAHLKALYYLTKSLDSTRLVIDNDGWEHTEVTDLFAIHDYTKTGDELYERFKNFVGEGVPLPLYGKLYLAPGFRYNGAPIFVSEFGGVGYVLPEDKSDVPHNSWGYSGVETSKAETLERIRGLYRAIARIRRIVGVCYTQLYDVEQEVNGLLTYDRRPKFDAAEIARINDSLV
jgi:beta-galactosidase/beta-glucuronidase